MDENSRIDDAIERAEAAVGEVRKAVAQMQGAAVLELLAEARGSGTPRRGLPWRVPEHAACLWALRQGGGWELAPDSPGVGEVARRLGRTPASVARRASALADPRPQWARDALEAYGRLDVGTLRLIVDGTDVESLIRAEASDYRLDPEDLLAAAGMAGDPA
jgi:hypothetical protein